MTFADNYRDNTLSAELVAIYCLFAFTVGSSLIGLYQFRKVKGEIYEFGNSILEGFTGALTEPTVKKAFTILGKQGGEAKADNLLVDQMAMDLLESPQFSALKMGASAMGFDLDDYIEKHGAVKTLKAAQQLANLVGIDIMKFDLSSLAGGGIGGGGGGGNPYLGGK